MPFAPQVDEQVNIGDTTYIVAEHPVASGFPYGQEGRQAVVYQLRGEDGTKIALKVFKTRFRFPGLVALADQIERYAGLPGLRVCKRRVLTPQAHRALLSTCADLTYAVLMPWIAGPTWQEIMSNDIGYKLRSARICQIQELDR